MLPQRKSYDAIVIGAGHNGLTAAAYLSRAGFSTLVVERREIVGGCCVTEEIAPGCRASTTSYIASMLRPTIIRDLDLGAHRLKMVPCDPGLLVPFPDGQVVPWWADRERAIAEFRQLSPRDADTFLRMDDQLKKLARYLQPFFLEPPPDPTVSGVGGWLELLRVGKRFRGMKGNEAAQLVSFLTGSLGDFLDRHYESEKMKTMFLANNVYGKHGGPYNAGSALGLLFHLLSGGDGEIQGFYGHVIGGMGAITQALASACRKSGAEILTSAPVAKVDVRDGRACGIVLEDGTEISARFVLSNADPKRTFLGLVEERELPADFRHSVAGIKMDGPCAKVNFVLSEEPRVTGMPREWPASQRALFTLVPSLEFAERCYDAAKFGEIPEELWVDCVVASNVDSTLAPPGKHVMTTFIQYVPYKLRQGTWDERRELLGDRVVKKIAEYAPNVPQSIIARQVLTPLDLERTYGLTEGNIFHGDLSLEQLFFMRPVAGWAQYRTPVAGLYLCGAGAHPGGGVTGAPGYNAAHQVLRDS
ncbi:MAG: NAD(P)/FAD-dependent oxidoreductase, partial [Candidatus Acidiferrales bacterium]